MAYLAILLAYQCLCFGEEEKTVNFQESPKSMGWVGGVRCLGKEVSNMTLFPHTLYISLHHQSIRDGKLQRRNNA